MYDYIKPIYQNNSELCYADTDSFIVYMKTENIYIDIADDVGNRYDTSNYEIKIPLKNFKK